MHVNLQYLSEPSFSLITYSSPINVLLGQTVCSVRAVAGQNVEERLE